MGDRRHTRRHRVLSSQLIFESAMGTGFSETWRVCGGPGAGGIDPCVANSGGTISTTVMVEAPFTFGTPLSLNFSLWGSAGTSSMSSGNGTSNGTIDAFNTAFFQPLIVLDSTGAPVLGASVVSNSGVAYAVAGTQATVPEPSSALLLGTGLVAAIRRRSRPAR